MTAVPIRAVFFDAVGTLIHPEPEAAVVYAGVGRRHGSRLDEATIRRSFRAAFGRQEEVDRRQQWRVSEVREAQRWQTIVREVLHDLNDLGPCFQELFAHFAQPANWALDPGAEVALRELERRGLPVGLASNFDGRLRQVVNGMPALAAVRHLVISAEIGWRKPAGEFFEKVVELAGVEPQAVLFVGDDVVNDFRGATTAGLKACLFDPREKATALAPRIASVLDVLQLL